MNDLLGPRLSSFVRRVRPTPPDVIFLSIALVLGVIALVTAVWDAFVATGLLGGVAGALHLSPADLLSDRVWQPIVTGPLNQTIGVLLSRGFSLLGEILQGLLVFAVLGLAALWRLIGAVRANRPPLSWLLLAFAAGLIVINVALI